MKVSFNELKSIFYFFSRFFTVLFIYLYAFRYI